MKYLLIHEDGTIQQITEGEFDYDEIDENIGDGVVELIRFMDDNFQSRLNGGWIEL